MAGGGGGHHVGGTGADGRRRDHDLPAAAGPGEAEGGQRHRLLVLPAPRGKLVLHRLERFGETRHVAVPEDSEDAREEPFPTRLGLYPLIAQVAHERLGHRESYRVLCHLFLLVSHLPANRSASDRSGFPGSRIGGPARPNEVRPAHGQDDLIATAAAERKSVRAW